MLDQPDDDCNDSNAKATYHSELEYCRQLFHDQAESPAKVGLGEIGWGDVAL